MLEQPGLLHHCNDAARSEYLVTVKWARQVSDIDAAFRSRAGLFTTQLVVASLAKQSATLRFVEARFGVSFPALLGIE
jgi:hypothetical protein